MDDTILLDDGAIALVISQEGGGEEATFIVQLLETDSGKLKVGDMRGLAYLSNAQMVELGKWIQDHVV